MMMLRQSNKNFVYRGFGIVQCDMQTLKMVIYFTYFLVVYSTYLSSLKFIFQMVNSVVSYYLLLKKI